MKSAYKITGELAGLKTNIQRSHYVQSVLKGLAKDGKYELLQEWNSECPKHGENNYILRSGDKNPILLTAHYDARLKNKNATEVFSGANDNSSGVGAVLYLADLLKGTSVDVALFGAEEEGLCGSRMHVNDIIFEGKQRPKYVINLDCVGIGEDVLIPEQTRRGFSYYNTDERTNSILTSNFRKIGRNVETLVKKNTASDHISFIRRGISASTIVGSGVYDVKRIHTDKDTIDTIDEKFLEDIILGTALSVEDLIRMQKEVVKKHYLVE